MQKTAKHNLAQRILTSELTMSIGNNKPLALYAFPLIFLWLMLKHSFA